VVPGFAGACALDLAAIAIAALASMRDMHGSRSSLSSGCTANVNFPASGLGLAVARRIVSRHHGRIAGSSGPGGEAEIRFTIRVAQT
jgi:hypothetical protein